MLTDLVGIHFIELSKFRKVQDKNYRENALQRWLAFLEKDITRTKIGSHGNHYGREAIGGLIEYAKELGYTKLMYPVDKKNIASKKIPLFYGGELIIENKLVTTPDGRTLDEEVYKITL